MTAPPDLRYHVHGRAYDALRRLVEVGEEQTEHCPGGVVVWRSLTPELPGTNGRRMAIAGHGPTIEDARGMMLARIAPMIRDAERRVVAEASAMERERRCSAAAVARQWEVVRELRAIIAAAGL